MRVYAHMCVSVYVHTCVIRVCYASTYAHYMIVNLRLCGKKTPTSSRHNFEKIYPRLEVYVLYIQSKPDSLLHKSSALLTPLAIRTETVHHLLPSAL